MKTIFLDCDGVLSAFCESACKACGHEGFVAKHWNFFESFGLNEVEFWAKIDEKGEDFWSNMPIYPWAKEVYDLCKANSDQVVILTSPPRAAWAWSGRVKWLQRHFGGPAFRDFALVPSGLKCLLAGRDRLLIDDSVSNVDQFKAAGGDALLFPQPWNCPEGMIGSREGFLKRNVQLWRRL